jgi:D-threo-aldose 1-dehydrogenase
VSAIGERRALRNGLTLPRLGFGGGSVFCTASEAEAAGLLDHAWAEGFRYFDTAPFYGHGLSEHRFGAGLREHPRDEFVLSTKVGRLLVPEPSSAPEPAQLPFSIAYDCSHDGAMRSFEHSLQRLGLARVDIVYLHDVSPRWLGEAYEARFREAMEGGYRALERLRAEGTIRAIAVGVKDWDVCLRFARAGDFDLFMLAGGYTLLEHAALNEFLPECQARGIAVVVASPFNSGILATGAVDAASFFYQAAPPDILARTRRLERVCARHGVALGAAALQFALAHPAVVGVVCGYARRAEIDTNIAWADVPIPAALWDDLKAKGLIAAEAPVNTQPQKS